MVAGQVDGVLTLAPGDKGDLPVRVVAAVTGQVVVPSCRHRLLASGHPWNLLYVMDHRLADWLVSGIVRSSLFPRLQLLGWELWCLLFHWSLSVPRSARVFFEP